MHKKIGNHRVEYKGPIDLMDRSSNMEIGLCWYTKESTISGRIILRII